MALDLTLLSLHRLNGQELPLLPGLLAVTPPRRTARGRERDAFVLALALSGNASLSDPDIQTLTREAAAAFYNSSGALTTALRLTAESVNRRLLERNLTTTGRGQYIVGSLILGALRQNQFTLLQCGPTHTLALVAGQPRRLYDPTLSGQEIGLNQTLGQYFSQLELQPGDRLMLCPMRALPHEWESALLSDRGLQPIEAARKRMMSLVSGDVSAALIQVTQGNGIVTIARPAASDSAPLPPTPRADEAVARLPLRENLPPAPKPTPSPIETLPAAVPAPTTPPPVEPPPAETNESLPAHVVGRAPIDQPSAYAIPPQPAEDDEALVEQLAEAAMAREFPPSIPRIKPMEPEPTPGPVVEAPARQEKTPAEPRVPSEGARQAARLAVRMIQSWRTILGRVGESLRRFAPRLLPGSETETSSSGISNLWGVFIAIAVPAVIATLGMVVYSRLGGTTQYQTYMESANAMRAQAMQETDPVRQREDWENVLSRVGQAEEFNQTGETIALRQEAQTHLDALLGISRLTYAPAFASNLSTDISRLAASETDLYMLDAVHGGILRAALTGRGAVLDTTFDCGPGSNNPTIGPMVDMLVLAKVNSLSSSVAGVDAAGNLLYCAPGQVAHPMVLPPPPTNWGRVTAVTLDGNKLYVLDAPNNAVWVYTGQDGVFTDAPYFYFGSQIPDIHNAIDVTVSGDELYLLHADGGLTHCTFSRVETAPTRCDSHIPLINPFPAYGDVNVFTQAHFTQMAFAAPPDFAMLMLDADGRSIFRISLRTFQLESIFGVAGNSVSLPGAFTAMTVSPSHVLYLALGGQVYYTNEAP